MENLEPPGLFFLMEGTAIRFRKEGTRTSSRESQPIRERRKPADSDITEELGEELEADAGSAKQEKAMEKNANLESAVQQKEERRNTDKLREDVESSADTTKQEDAAEEWFETEWWTPPETPLPPVTTQAI
ncbi:hypothetical protein NDU88_001818 [Pleurodeles waltl]|uniref:Uncharacterized protein n=1 Tax=Pleurodeles waltl TaxID=8319 RepID=A0AAV7V8V8_PLEWA|nr:hypothetical protein NDU88_001818 [Pleurodeles waltl]